MKKTISLKAALILLAVIAVVAIAIGPLRLHKARKSADEFASRQDLDLRFEGQTEIGSKEAFLTEIWRLAVWEEETRRALNSAFGYTDSWSHMKHEYGDMIWEKGGQQIFRVHYSDGKITNAYDSRGSTARSPWVSSKNSSPKKSFDPDDHDIEAYYADNRDEDGDYDDAYEGFLEDEGAWDDY